MRSKTIAIALSLFAVSLVPRVSFADSVKLTFTNTSNSPYDFTVQDYTTNTTTYNVALSCLSDQLDINNQNNGWAATSVNVGYLVAHDSLSTVVPVTTSGGVLTVAELEGDAYLDSLYGSNSSYNSDVQNAIWDILNPGSVSLDNTASTLYNDALKVVNQQTTETSAFYSQFTFYYPDETNCTASGSGNNGWGWNQTPQCSNEPQPFMGYTPSTHPPVTPEPSSLILMGTGLLGAAGALRRKFKK
jgi:hypothetical protein